MRKAISVKVLNQYIKSELMNDPILKNVYVVGEVTNLHKNKFMYFDLKEEDDLINCVYFNNDLDFSNGDNIIVNGSINTYTRASRYQITVRVIQAVGQGQAHVKLKLLKEKLDKKGYFDLSRKKSIPDFPVNIGLITSAKSAAIVDFLSILKANYPIADILLYPTRVQGLEAKVDIIEALQRLDLLGLDLLVMTRGGGSNEDLSIFNDEEIADTIYNLQTPIISAVGHEIDTTIADLVSDLRLSTPTKAAEYIVGVFNESLLEVNNLFLENNKIIMHLLETNLYQLNIEKLQIEANSPKNRIENYLKDIQDIDKFNKEILVSQIFSKNKIINETKNIIEDEINRILHENMMKIFELDMELVDVNNLSIDKEYYMQNDRVRYKIKVMEKFND